ncbi:FAD-dependent oxidoreductase [Actinomadura sp. 9N215]|uniref:FAD-dependent oxidoreductase n=1 Tax=Actinomadura sp. 9N215 TaxID=3375150 RepID=UPI00378C4113
MMEGAAESYWMATSQARTYPRLSEDAEADVAVVGGGIAGIATAWELAQAGRSVVLLEAHRIAAGVTGYTTGRLSAAHPWIYAQLRDGYGLETARLYARSQQEAVEHVVATAEKLGIDADIERRPSHVYVEEPDRVQDLRIEVEAAQQAGLAASFVSGTDLPYEVAGALRVQDQVQFHPRRYLLALVEEFCRAGGRVHEHTRVIEMDEGRPSRLVTDTGTTIRANEVVIATLFPVLGGGMLGSRLTPLRELVIATPISRERDPGGMYITREENTRSVRTAPYRDGRRLLLITGESFPPGTADVAARRQHLVEWTRQHFQVDDIAYWWAAQDLDTADKIPYVGRIGDNVYVATGYARSGMSHGIMSGKLLTGLICGKEPPWAGVYAPGRKHFAQEVGPMSRALWSKTRRAATDHAQAMVTSADDIPQGSGAVVRHHGRLLAVYKGDDGTTHWLSPHCSHFRCLVSFNDTERVWECPCHGCRYAPDGSVLQGPATADLRPEKP